jgi:alpha-1,3-rhamnosyltransferase
MNDPRGAQASCNFGFAAILSFNVRARRNIISAPTVTNTPHSAALPHADVSVVVPSYNHARFVEKCLRSIFRQTLRPRELLVIDDGSKDDSPRIIERVLRDAPVACELIVRPNRGLAATLNEGLAHTRGAYFAYLGSDDLWLADFLAARVAQLEARPRAVLAYGHAYSIDAAERIIDCTTDWARYVDGDARAMLLTTLAPLSPTVVYRRAALPVPAWNEQARLEDYELYLRLSATGEFAFDARVLSAWRQHDSNASQNLTMMLAERLAAQQRAAEALGLSARALAGVQALARFRSAQEFMRQGHKRTALGLLLKDPRGAPSLVEAARLVAGLVVPHGLLRRRKRRLRQQAGARYGALPL